MVYLTKIRVTPQIKILLSLYLTINLQPEYELPKQNQRRAHPDIR